MSNITSASLFLLSLLLLMSIVVLKGLKFFFGESSGVGGSDSPRNKDIITNVTTTYESYRPSQS